LEYKNKSVFVEVERFERTIFKTKFKNWPIENSSTAVLAVKTFGNIKTKDKSWKIYDRGMDAPKRDKVDIEYMYAGISSPVLSSVTNSESGENDLAELLNRDWGFEGLRIWRVHDMSGDRKTLDMSKTMFDFLEVHFGANEPFVFYSEECYIFFYEYKERPPQLADPILLQRLKKTKEDLRADLKTQSVLYTWIGQDSKVTDQSLLAHMVKELEKCIFDGSSSSRSKSRHSVVYEEKEPPHFVKMIRGFNPDLIPKTKFLEHFCNHNQGLLPAICVRRGSKTTYNKQVSSVYNMSGIHPHEVRVTQVLEPSWDDICLGHTYIICFSGTNIISWHGEGSFEWETEIADYLAEVFSQQLHCSWVQICDDQDLKQFKDKLPGELDSHRPHWLTKRHLMSVETPNHEVFTIKSNAIEPEKPYRLRLWRVSYFVNGNPTVNA
jgi:hypothetical protein